MLRELAEHYLDGLKDERSFDSPFLALLAAEGFDDIHFLHGATEFGKDFIAKQQRVGVLRQYVFQNKAGNVDGRAWREAKPQLLESVTSSLGHPRLDASLPRTIVLVLTGVLRGNAQLEASDFARYVSTTFPAREFVVWDREDLISLIQGHGPEQLYRSANDVSAFGELFRLYGDTWTKSVKTDDIQQHFARRLTAIGVADDRLASTLIETELLSDASRRSGQPYSALQAALSALRAVLYEMQSRNDAAAQKLGALLVAACDAIAREAAVVVDFFVEARLRAGNLYEAMGGAGLFVAYPIVCSQLCDGLVLGYAFGGPDVRERYAELLREIIRTEPGVAHPISDRYAVSILGAVRVLHEVQDDELARTLLKNSALWLVDRYWQDGPGLAASDSTELEEILQLLGTPFSGTKVARNEGSLLASALMDAACFLQEREVYNGLRADIAAADIVPHYYQVKDTLGQFVFDAEDVVRMPNVEFADTMPAFASLSYGSHLAGEPASFRLQQFAPNAVYLALSLLLRDRYFPTTWNVGVSNRALAANYA